MKKPATLIIVATALAAIIFGPGRQWFSHSHHGNSKEEEFEANEENENEEAEERETMGVDKELTSWFQSRGFPDPYHMEAKYMRAWEYAVQLKKQAEPAARGEGINTNGNWTSIGPNNGIGGRVLTIAINPVKTTSLYIGSASGGIWKSYNGASSWQHVETGFPLLGVASIIINPSDTNIIYAGTGEVYRTDTSVNTSSPNPNHTGYNVWKTRGTFGIGILKSADGGNTWSQVLVKDVSNLFAIQRLRFNPLNPKSVYACATDGLYKSIDAGGTWIKILNLAHITDVVINAKDTMQLVAAVGNLGNTVKGIFRSTNNGGSWTKITSGLPATFRGFIKLDNVTLPGSRDTILASIGVDETGSPNELYRTTNFGTSWTALAGSAHASYQHWSAHTVGINPFFPDSLAYAGVNSFKYKISTSTAAGTSVGHADNHDIQFDPQRRGTYYVACDGGIYKTTNGGTSFTASNTNLAISQFYASIAVSSTDPNLIIGGLQDINAVRTSNGGTSWSTMAGMGGDGTACYFDPLDDDTVISSNDARTVYVSYNKGVSNTLRLKDLGGIAANGDSRTSFNTPLAITNTSPAIMYAASDNLHKSTDKGVNWSNTSSFASGNIPQAGYIDKIHRPALAFEVASSDPNRLYASTTPFAQADNDVDSLFVDRTKGADFLRSMNAGGTLPFTSIMNNLPNRYVLDIYVSPTNADSVWVTLGGFGTAHVYVTANAGASPASNVVWTPKDGGPSGNGLPDVPTNAIIHDPVNPSVLYVGNDLGVYVTSNNGVSWQDFTNGLWDATMVFDLRITANSKLLAATHGKGAFISDLFTDVSLPSHLINFAGVTRGGFNELHWDVTEEQNVNRYEVERSSDGFNFQLIGSKPSLNSSVLITYRYNDPLINGISEYYYRLKTVDEDGKITYSPVIYLRIGSKGNITVVTNPFRDNISLRYNLPKDQKLTVRVFNAAGALMRREEYYVRAGAGAYTMYGFEFFARGMYFLKAETEDFQQTIKLIKN